MAKACRDIKNYVATSNGQTMSRHQKLCRDTEMLSPCRDTKNCVATYFSSPRSFRVATPKAMSRHPKGYLCRDMKNHVATQNQPSPSPSHVATQELMSQHRAKSSSRTRAKRCRKRTKHCRTHVPPPMQACSAHTG